MQSTTTTSMRIQPTPIEPSQCNLQQLCIIRDSALHAKLDHLDEAIRGNGRPGIQLRLFRLEAAEAVRRRLLWIIAGAAVTLAVAALWRLVVGG